MPDYSIPELYTESYDLKNCDKEPLRIIRRLQSYASLLVLDENYSQWYFATEDLLAPLSNEGLYGVFDEADLLLTRSLSAETPTIVNSCLGQRLVTKYIKGELLYLEFEQIVEDEVLSESYEEAILEISEEGTLNSFLNTVLKQVQNITGYSHTMIYEFDDDYNGQIINELRSEDRTSYLGLKFPSTDIPVQARALYFEEGIRTIASVNHKQKPIFFNKAADLKVRLDLSGIHSRGVSPIHLEYLSNIEVRASFSVAIIRNNKLWGLIVCHNTSPKMLGHKTRRWLKFLSKFISNNLGRLISEKDANVGKQRELDKNIMISKLLDSKNLIGSLVASSPSLLDLISADGLVVKSGNKIRNLGETIDESKLDAFFSWLSEKDGFNVISTSFSIKVLPSNVYDKRISGLLIIQLSHISQDYIVFTRKEEGQTVNWAGNPNKAKSFDEEKKRMTPRKSFELWKGRLEDTAKPWTEEELIVAQQIKNEIREYLYKKYNELMLLNKELQDAYANMESFSYTVSHDLKAPLRSIQGFAQILTEDYRDRLDEYGIKLLDMISANISKMNAFIKDILHYSSLNSNELKMEPVKLGELIDDVWGTVKVQNNGAEIVIQETTPTVYGDYRLLSQVFLNLFSNSLKYIRSGTTPRIHVQFEHGEEFVQVIVEDNGIGIPKGSEERIFEVFRRLVREDEYEGTGIGLAIVKKVIERHGGVIQTVPSNKSGATFVFTLPVSEDYLRIRQINNNESH